jgi:restriction system protein
VSCIDGSEKPQSDPSRNPRQIRGLPRSSRKNPTINEEGRKQIVAEVRKDYYQNKKANAGDELPEDSEESISKAATDYRQELLAALQAMPPAAFERLSQRLLRESGFERVIVTGKTGDGGIDGHGVLQVNAFVSFRALFQCKRFKGAVGAGAVRDFRGAMQGRAEKGIILTTGTFTPGAEKEATRDGVPPIELVDGDALVTHFEKIEFGLRRIETFEVDHEFLTSFYE